MLLILIFASILTLYITWSQKKIRKQKKMHRQQKLKDAQDAYNKSFGIEIEDKLLPVDFDAK